MEKLGSHWVDFHEIWYLSIFQRSVKKLQVSSKSDKNNGYFTWRSIYIFEIISHSFFCRMRNVSDKSCRENQTHILCSTTFFSKIVPFMRQCVKTVEPDRPQMTIWCTRIACWISKATDMFWEYVILIAFPLQQYWVNAPQCYIIHSLLIFFKIVLAKTGTVHIEFPSTAFHSRA